jgi:hypothetical protein
MFAPEHWGTLTKFSKFAHSTYTFKGNSGNALRGVEGHFQKYLTLRRLADRLIPILQEDIADLKERNFTTSKRSKELTAIVETLFCELYSTLDCTRDVMKVVLVDKKGKPLQGIPEKKTSTLFKNAADGTLSPDIPSSISNALAEAYNSWFPMLRDIRTWITHFEIGHCWVGKDNKVSYMNAGLGPRSRAFVIEDVFDQASVYEKNVNQFLGIVYGEFLKTLNDIPDRQVCCFGGNDRLYERYVSPKDAVDRNSGVCYSYTWFDKEETLFCPLKLSCKAYERATD